MASNLLATASNLKTDASQVTLLLPVLSIIHEDAVAPFLLESSQGVIHWK